MTFRGLVESVDTVPAGDFVTADLAAGTTLIPIDNTDVFETDTLTGEIELNGVTYQYVSVDPVGSTITLSAGLSGAAEVNDRATVLPLTPETTAQVVLSGADGAISVRVPAHLATLSSLADGIRDPNARETVLVDMDGGQAVVVEIVNEEPLMNAARLDPATAVPPSSMTDGLPPASSPTPVTVGGLRQIFVKWEPVVNADLTTYELHVTDTAGAAAPTAGGATLFAETPGTMLAANQEADGTAFGYDTDYFFSLIAKDADGAAVASPWVSGRMDRTASGDLVAGSVTTETLNSLLAILGTLQIGGSLIELSPPTSTPNGTGGFTLAGGIVVKDPDNPSGEPLIRLHPMGSTFRKTKLETDLLTVLQNLLVNGNARLAGGSTFTASAGIPDPTTGPTWTTGPAVGQAWPAMTSGYYQAGVQWAGTQFYELAGFASGGENRAAVRTVSTSGVAGSWVTLGRTLPSGASGSTSLEGFAVVGSSVFHVWTTYTSKTRGFITKTDLSGNVQAQIEINPSGTGSSVQQIGPDYTGGGVVTIANQNNGSSWPLVRYDASLTETGRITPPSSWINTSTQAGAVMLGSFDFGSLRLVVARNASSPSRKIGQVWTPDFTAGTLTEITSQNWRLASASDSGQEYLTWDGTRFRSLIKGGTTVNDWSTYVPNNDQIWSAVYADKTSAGITKPSPATTVTVPPRHFPTLTLGPAPSPSVNGADVWVGYSNTGDAATKYKRAETLSGRVMTLTALKQTSGTTTLPTTNTAGGAAALWQSETVGWSGSGDGTFIVKTPTAGNHAATKDYVDASGTVFPARDSLASYTTGVTYTVFDIRRTGKWREIRGNPNRSLPTGSTDITTALPTTDRPSMNVFANAYLAGGNVGVVFIRPDGTMALNNMSGATRSGSHQFTLIYTVD